jgi:hypothetical protein
LTVEVTNISANGIWLLIDEEENLLSFEDFPWFRFASVDEIVSVERVAPQHLYWEKLDVDLHSIRSITPSVIHLRQKFKVERLLSCPESRDIFPLALL